MKRRRGFIIRNLKGDTNYEVRGTKYDLNFIVVKKIDTSLFEKVGIEAIASPRRRKNFNFHEDYADPVQRILHIVQPLSYVQPHKHENPDKIEMFIVLKGRFVYIEYDQEGNIIDHILLDTRIGNYGVEITPKAYHSIISLEESSAILEIKDGPYLPIADKDFATWAPREGDANCREYLLTILRTIGIPYNS